MYTSRHYRPRRYYRRSGRWSIGQRAVVAAVIVGVIAGGSGAAAAHGHGHGHGGNLHVVGGHGWKAFLAAIRAQESGGNYGEDTTGCLGAYCWDHQAIWDGMANAAGLGQYAGSDPAGLPSSVQDAVASRNLRKVYRANGRSLTAAAEWWNGGRPYSIPNPGLPAQPWAPQCGSGSTAAYACQVLARIPGGG